MKPKAGGERMNQKQKKDMWTWLDNFPINSGQYDFLGGDIIIRFGKRWRGKYIKVTLEEVK
jgi:hypothetical protein